MIFSRHPCQRLLPPRTRSLSLKLSQFTFIHPFCIQVLTKCSSSNSFVFNSMHFDGGGYPLLVRSGTRRAFFGPRDWTQVLSFHPIAHSFALTKIKTLLFLNDSTLFAQNTRLGGYAAEFEVVTEQNKLGSNTSQQLGVSGGRGWRRSCRSWLFYRRHGCPGSTARGPGNRFAG